MSQPGMSDVHTPNAGGKKKTFKDYWAIRGQTKSAGAEVDKDYYDLRSMTKEFFPMEEDLALSCAPKKAMTFKDYWEIRRQTKGCSEDQNKACSPNVEKRVARFNVVKADAEQHLVTGWASVIEEDGKPVVDWQGDVMSEEDLVKAAHGFVSNYRVGKTMHSGAPTSNIVDSVVFTKDLQKALGVDLGKVGWLITTKVSDPDTWEKVKKGELKAFSIGGSGVRSEL